MKKIIVYALASMMMLVGSTGFATYNKPIIYKGSNPNSNVSPQKVIKPVKNTQRSNNNWIIE